jgi:chromosome partitioning protein
MRVVAILNQKGGVGKTTTAVNLGAALARRGRRVLLVDMDPQCNLTDHLGVELDEDDLSVYDVLASGASLDETIVPTATEGLDVAPADEDLAGVEVEMAGWPGREALLRRAIEALPQERYDWVIVDCPPSLGLLSLNAMAACPEIFITLQTEYFALRGLGQLARIVEMVRSSIHPELRIAGILPTLVSPVTNLAREVLEEVQEHFGDRVFRTRIRQNVRLAEAPGHQQHIFDYAPHSAGAHDYEALAAEVEAAEVEAAEGAGPAADADPGAPAEVVAMPDPPLPREVEIKPLPPQPSNGRSAPSGSQPPSGSSPPPPSTETTTS